MKRRVVTCPETGRDVTIGYLDGRDGLVLVVLRCPRFAPPEAVDCRMACADAHNERLWDEREPPLG